MSEDIDTIRQQLWEKMRDKSYRVNFVAAQVSTGISAQLVTMREARQWQQKEVAEKAGMKPARISVLENPSYDKFTLTTLKRLASAFDVAVVVKFVSFHDLVDWISDLSPLKLNAVEFSADKLTARLQRPAGRVVNISTRKVLDAPAGAAAGFGPNSQQIQMFGGLDKPSSAATANGEVRPRDVQFRKAG